jgi:3-hydroxyacyl-CoA dehydrogenase/enoyl-CoA hydratase/3-hydroxybutyryl-CoA epimerase
VRALDILERYANEGLEASQDLEARAFGELASSDVARQLVQVFLATLASRDDRGIDTPGVRGRAVKRVALVGDEPSDLGAASARAGLEISNDPRDADLVLVSGTGGAPDPAALRRVEDASPERALIVCSLTSLLSDVVSASQFPGRVLGARQAGVGSKLPLLEIVRGEASSDEAVATAVMWGKRLGKTVIVVRDTANGYAHRLRESLADEARLLIEEGLSPAVVGEALLAWGWTLPAIAPFEGEGGGSRLVPPEDSASTDRIVERCVLRIVNEAVDCLDQSIIRSPRDGDLGAIEGVGFPRFQGGPFRHVDAIGAPRALARLGAREGRLGGPIAPAQGLVTAARDGSRFY